MIAPEQSLSQEGSRPPTIPTKQAGNRNSQLITIQKHIKHLLKYRASPDQPIPPEMRFTSAQCYCIMQQLGCRYINQASHHIVLYALYVATRPFGTNYPAPARLELSSAETPQSSVHLCYRCIVHHACICFRIHRKAIYPFFSSS